MEGSVKVVFARRFFTSSVVNQILSFPPAVDVVHVRSSSALGLSNKSPAGVSEAGGRVG